MPSPIGHALAGIAAGCLIAPRQKGFAGVTAWQVGLYAAAGMAADADLLIGVHSGPTHGVGAAVAAGVIALIVALIRQSDGGSVRLGIAVMAAYATHTLLDWLGSDSSPPIGIMALWPFSREYDESPLHLFMAISRRYWLDGFWSQNLQALVREIVILGPIVAAVYLVRRAG